MMTVGTNIQPSFPRYWLNTARNGNGGTVYIASCPDCTGYYWHRGGWVSCAKDGTMVDHAAEYPDTFRPITFVEAARRGVPAWEVIHPTRVISFDVTEEELQKISGGDVGLFMQKCEEFRNWLLSNPENTSPKS